MKNTNKLQQSLSAAINLHRAGNLDGAEAMYQRILLSYPSNPDALNGLAALQIQRGNFEEIVRLIRLSLQVKPLQPDALNILGNALRILKRFDEAREAFDKAIELSPDYALAHYNRGVTLMELNRYDEALSSYDKAIAIKADYVEAYTNRGTILHQLKLYDDALASYEKALLLNPNYALVYNNRANVLQDMKRYGDALDSYDQAIALNPHFAEAYYNRGVILQEMKRYDEALANYDKAIVFKGDYVEAYINQGNILRELWRYGEALKYYDKAIEINPRCAEAYYNRGVLMRTLKRYDEALENYRQAVKLKSDIPYLLGDVLNTRMHLSDWDKMDDDIALLTKELEAGKRVVHPFILLALPSSELQQKQCAEMNAEDACVFKVVPHSFGKPYTHEKIRIGYFSADFHHHATAYLMVGLLELHDRNRFEISGFSYGPAPHDDMRSRIANACDHFFDVNHTSDKDIITLARSKEIDIAVDLGGFTKNARTELFAGRPAPVQAHYLGYPGTIGANYIDYLIADPVVIPDEHRKYYTEKIAYLPDCYQVNDTQRTIFDSTPSRQELGLPEKGFVFCCFNNIYKITPDLFSIWMQLLHEVPGSVLWLLEGNSTSANNLRKEAEARGIPDKRLVFAPRLDLPRHLARHRHADLFLDTLPYNAHTTASDALWTGLPVLTRIGDTFAGRVAASLLKAIGLSELIVHTKEDYKTRAIDFALHPEKLSAVRRVLQQNRTTHPLFNTELFARQIEKAYIQMWERSQAGLKPDHIFVQ